MNMILKKALLIFLLTFFVTNVNSQRKERVKGDKNVTIKETKINSFNRIVVGENFKVDIIEGSEASVFVETDDNLHDVINFSVTDSTLSFQTTKRITISKKLSIKVIYTPALKQIETIEDGEISSLTVVNLDDIVLKNSGTSRAYLNIKTNKFRFINSDRAKVKLNVTSSLATLELSDNSKVEALINADTLQVDMYLRSDAKIEGDVSDLNIRTDNSTNFVGKGLTSNTCTILCEGNSDVHVQVVESVTIEASENGEIYIYDNPKITLNKFTDTAKLHKKEMKP